MSLYCEIIFIYPSEKRLNRIEGSGRNNANKLTSKDILSSLTQAKEDHLNPDNMGEGTAWTETDYSEHDTHTTIDQSEYTNNVMPALYLCCWCCKQRQAQYATMDNNRAMTIRTTRGSTNSNDIEYACLVDCDELELNNNEEDNT